jgi:outer membrane biosynthesis protein TonB
MSTARRLLSAAVLGSMLVIGCTSPKSAVEPPVETPTPPVVDAAPTGPPPGYIQPTNYWVREKIILTSEPAPPAQKSVVKKGKKHKKTSKLVTEHMEFRG